MEDVQASVANAISGSFDQWVEQSAIDLLEDGTLDSRETDVEQATTAVLAFVQAQVSQTQVWVVRCSDSSDVERTEAVNRTLEGANGRLRRVASHMGWEVAIDPTTGLLAAGDPEDEDAGVQAWVVLVELGD